MKTKLHKRMFVAIAENDLKAVKQMTEVGFPHDSQWYHGRTSLHLAIEERKKKVVEFLLQSGVNPNIRDDQGEDTPLHLAAREGYADFVKLLLVAVDALDRLDSLIVRAGHLDRVGHGPLRLGGVHCPSPANHLPNSAAAFDRVVTS